MPNREKKFMAMAIALAQENVHSGMGGPFAAIVVKDGVIVGKGCNSVTSANDPTAHAEINAIRDACKNLSSFQLYGCEIYSSCEPCPMCLGAIYWARPEKLYYAATKHDASNAGFDDSFIYQQIELNPVERSIPFINMVHDDSNLPFIEWKNKNDKTAY